MHDFYHYNAHPPELQFIHYFSLNFLPQKGTLYHHQEENQYDAPNIEEEIKILLNSC